MAIPKLYKRNLTTHGVQAQASFGISSEDSAHIMRILRDQLYSDTVLAVLREYSSNAWDANRAAGKKDVPIYVALPNDLQPYLKIRDQGPGLSHDDVFKVFTQYGASTKRDTNEALGELGIGSKSGFAYTSSFTVTSWHEGTKRVYNASLDERDIGVIQLLHEEECEEETGLEIKIPVRNADFNEFRRKAVQFFQWFNPRPIFNIDLQFPEIKTKRFNNGYFVFDNNNHPYAILGCVPYKISNSAFLDIWDGSRAKLGISPGHLILEFDIGEVDFSANREELKYTKRTNEAIKKKVVALREEVIEDAKTVVSRKGISNWQKRVELDAYQKFGIMPDMLYKDINKTIVFVDTNDPLKHFEPSVDRLNHVNCFFLVEDLRKARTGWNIPFSQYGHAIFIKPKTRKGKGVQKAIEELEKVLIREKADGAPIWLASESENYWVPPRRNHTYGRNPDYFNPKHAQKVFKIVDKDKHVEKASDRWEVFGPLDEPPNENDVFVIIEKFVPQYGGDMFYEVRNLREAAKAASITFPRIVGYKTTSRNLITESDVEKGKPYRVWKKEFVDELKKNQKLEKAYQAHLWRDNLSSREETIEKIVSSFDELRLHPSSLLYQYFKKTLEAKRVKNVPNLHYIGRIAVFESEPEVVMSEINKRYPLMGTIHSYNFLDHFKNKETLKHWVDYVKMIDERNQR